MAPAVRAQTEASMVAAAPNSISEGQLISEQQIDVRLAELADAPDIDPATKDTAKALFESAKDQLNTARRERDAAAKLAELMSSGPEQIRNLQAQLASEGPRSVFDDPRIVSSGESTADIALRLEKQESLLGDLRAQAANVEAELNRIRDRPRLANVQITAARDDLKQINQEHDSPSDGTRSPVVNEARRVLLESRRAARLAEIARLDQERLVHDVRVDLAEARRDLVSRKVADAAEPVDGLRDLLEIRRRDEAARASATADRATRELGEHHTILRETAQQNAAYGEEYARVVEAQAAASRQFDDLQAQTKGITEDFIQVRRRLDTAGPSPALGKILREQRRRLTGRRQQRAEIARQDKLVADASAAQFRVQDRLKTLDDIDAEVEQILDRQLEDDAPPVQRATIRLGLNLLLENQRDLLDKLDGAYDSHLRTLIDIDFQTQRLAIETEAYVELLDEHLLWIPSGPPVGLDTHKDLPAALEWLLSPGNWIRTAQAMWLDFLRVPVLYLVAAALLLALVRIRAPLVTRLSVLADNVGRIHTDRFRYTLQALGITVLMALLYPLESAFVGWRLNVAEQHSDFQAAIGSALVLLAVYLFLLRTLYQLCRPDGLGRAHFHWRDATLLLVRDNLRWFTVFIVPVMIVGRIDAARLDSDAQSLAVFAFISLALALALFAKRLFDPHAGVFAELLARYPNGWLARLRYVWFALIVGIPIGLALLAGFGFTFTASALGFHLVATFWVITTAVVLHNLASRWLIVAHRQLALRQAREKLAASRADDEPGEGPALDTEKIDINAINAQNRHLLNNFIGWGVVIVMWFIWSSVVPALGMLDNVALWNQTVMIGDTAQVEPITLADLIRAFVIGAIVAVAARNLPGVLEILVLQRLPLDSGSRYAVTKVSQYLIVTIGIFLIFGSVGVSWSSVQWLVAAMGVGLGFGLQEIVANFISGLIMLFERPVRIGDTVTIGTLTGDVSQIRIRSTTIRDWDNKEIIVPNKNFITNQLVNWTLTDPINRIIVPVGIAYGSDTNLAYRVIMEVAETNSRVLKTPPPKVVFKSFGESSYNFELRVFVKDLNDWLPAIHEMHMGITDALAENNIEIPFPQRDLHLRTWAPRPEDPSLGLDDPSPATGK